MASWSASTIRRLLILVGCALGVAVASAVVPAAGATHQPAKKHHKRSHSHKRAPRTTTGSSHVLRVGTYRGIPGQYSDVQAAIDAAKPGDWILVAPGDYREALTRPAPGSQGDDRAGAGVLIQTSNIHLRGMDRNRVVLDGTKSGPPCSSAESDQNFGENDAAGKPSGRNGVLVYKARDVTVENLTACNFLNGDNGGGNQIWWDGGGASGTQTDMGWWRGAYLSATSTFFKDQSSPAAGYGIYSSNTKGTMGTFEHTYASNMNDSAYYVGACPDCEVTLNDIHGEYSALGYSGTNSGGFITIENSEFDNNEDGFDTNSQNNNDAPSPQDGACPNGIANPNPPPKIQRTHSCWIFTHNYVHDNNNPNIPSAGAAAAGPVGTGMSISGGRHDIVTDNLFANNNAWGIILVPYPDTETPPPIANCQGGANVGTPAQPVCYFDDWGSEIANNRFVNNGSYHNQTNGDIADLSGGSPNSNPDSNCYHDNTNLNGPLTSDPANIDSHSQCGQTYQSNSLASPFGLQVACDSQLLSTCPSTTAANYPRRTQVVLKPLPHEKSMPHPCAGVPANPWCPASSAGSAHKPAARHRARSRKHHKAGRPQKKAKTKSAPTGAWRP